MKFFLGTAGLKQEYNHEYEKIFFEAVNDGIPIHTSLDYKNCRVYFNNSYKNNNRNPKLIIKLFINKNPLKKILNINSQIQKILDFYKLENIHILQICNNPKNDFFNYLILEKIIKKLKRKKLCNYAYFDTYYDYNHNLSKYLNNPIYDGYIATYNLFKKGITNEFYNKIILSNKNIIAISPLNSGHINNEFSSSDLEVFKQIAKKNNLENLFDLSLCYLKTLKLYGIISGTKKYTRFKSTVNFLSDCNTLNEDSMQKILSLNKKVKYFNSY